MTSNDAEDENNHYDDYSTENSHHDGNEALPSINQLQKSSALLLLGLNEKYQITASHVHGLEECFTSSSRPFSGLETPYQQKKFFVDNCNLIVSVHLICVTCVSNINDTCVLDGQSKFLKCCSSAAITAIA